jgi:CHAT domain-containing protein
LPQYIGKIRHSNASYAIKLAEGSYSDPKVDDASRWRLSLLYAELILDQGNGADKVSDLLALPIPPEVPIEEAEARIASVKGYIAQARSRWDEAEALYDKAYARMVSLDDDPCWKAELLVHHQAQTQMHRQNWSSVTILLKQAHRDSAACPDKYWESLAPNVEGNTYNYQTYYEKAVDSYLECLNLARQNKLPQLIEISQGNVALGYHNLGAYDNALKWFDQTDTYYQEHRPLTKKQRGDWAVAKGHRARTYLAIRKYDDAIRFYREAIQAASENGDPNNADRFRAELTSLYTETRDYQSAEQLNQQVLEAATLNDFPVMAGAQLNGVRLARLRGDLAEARVQLDKLQQLVDQHPEQKDPNPKLIWQMHGERALILAGLKSFEAARREFDAALLTSTAASRVIKADEYRLTYFLPLVSLYQNYVDFLASRNLSGRALQVAEAGRARVLAEKLRRQDSPQAANRDFTSIARAKKAVVLSYSTAPARSYMWATTAHGSELFVLPPEGELETLIKRHNEPILEERSLAEDQSGRALYDLLIGPAAKLIPANSNVIVIPDGPLYDLNFETLIPPGAEPHYWLESAVVSVAPSLTLLLAQEQRAIDPASILAIGRAVQADTSLPSLGGEELQVLERLYGSRCKVLQKADATPAGFLQANPESFSLLHFSAHAISNPQSPLDSYIVLSPQAANEYKLYARDFSGLRLRADLVTLSACQSAGAKNVPGEGPVGLTWAVLSAGARNVVASLWPVAEVASNNLMQRFYAHLHAGEPPDLALHSAKLEMARAPQSVPYQWAAFQLYSR